MALELPDVVGTNPKFGLLVQEFRDKILSDWVDVIFHKGKIIVLDVLIGLHDWPSFERGLSTE